MYDSICIKFPEKSNLCSWDADQWLHGLESGGTQTGMREIFELVEMHNWFMVMVVQVCKCTKNNELYTCNGWTLFILIKLFQREKKEQTKLTYDDRNQNSGCFWVVETDWKLGGNFMGWWKYSVLIGLIVIHRWYLLSEFMELYSYDLCIFIICKLYLKLKENVTICLGFVELEECSSDLPTLNFASSEG